MLTQWGIQVLQNAVNTYLQLDPELFTRLEKLDDKVIALQIKGLPTILYIRPSIKGLIFSKDYEGHVETTISGSLLSLASIGWHKGIKINRELFGNDISITGDLEFGESFKEILDSIEIDWEYYLSHAVGDVMAHHVGSSINGFMNWSKELFSEVVQNTKEYFQEESLYLPPHEEFDDFSDDINELIMAVDRFEARLKVLLKQTQGIPVVF